MKQRALLTIALLAATTFRVAAQGSYADHSVLASGTWVKISVGDAGVYQITNSALKSMGFSDPDAVKLYGLNLSILPEDNIEDIADDLVEMPLYRTSEKVLFYGRGPIRYDLSSVSSSSALFTHTQNPYATRICYFLTDDATDGSPLSFDKYAYEVDDAVTVSYFPDCTIIDDDAYSFLNSGRTFFEGYDYSSGSTRSYTLSLPDKVEGSSVRLAIQFAASGSSASSLSIACNDSSVATLSFAALGSYEEAKTSSRTSIITTATAGDNTITLTHSRASGVSGRLDYLRASFLRSLNMTGDELLFRPVSASSHEFELTGGDASTVFWHITNADEIEEIDASYSDGTWTIPFTPASDWQAEELLAVNPSATFPSPTVEGTIENQDLHALSDVDYVIIIPANGKFLTQAQRLADAHEEVDGMTYAIVRADQVYNEFSCGTPDATAIRRFMKMLYDKASSEQTRPRNLLLFGPGVWDNRMVTSALSDADPDDYLLCYEGDNSVSHTSSYVLEEYYALVDDDCSSSVLNEYPRIGVGRIPAETLSEAKAVVDKLLTYIYNEQTGSWKNVLCFMADDGNDNIHMEDAEAVISQTESLYPDYFCKRIYWDTYTRESNSTSNTYPGVETDIDKQMEDGALVMNYTGHGAAYVLSHERVMLTTDFADWDSPRLPLWFHAACDVAPFDMNEENIGVTALLNESGAAMGVVSTARTVYSSPNRAINLQFMKYVLGTDSYGRRITIGEALSLAKAALVGTSYSSVNKAHFVLLGDPAIALQVPTYQVVVDEINGQDTTGDDLPTISAGDLVTVQGHIEDEDGNASTSFNGLISPTIYDSEETVTCLNNSYGETNGNTETEPYEFVDRTRTLYILADTIQAGSFSFTFPLPLDNSYSGEQGLISLYAVSEDSTCVEAHGQSDAFTISGTASSTTADTEGPTITYYLNQTSFVSGDVVNATPQLHMTLYDESGLNMTGNGVGHDIALIIDDAEALTYSLNSYFTPTTGDYRSGTIDYSIPELEDGEHTLLLRAYDILNNPASVEGTFVVDTSGKPTIYSLSVSSPVTDEAVITIENDRPGATLTVHFSAFDVTGRKVWSTTDTSTTGNGTYTYTWNLDETDAHLPAGIYILKAGIRQDSGPEATEAVKFIVLSR